MAEKNSIYKLRIDGEIGGLLNKVNDAKKALKTLVDSGNAPAGITKSFEKLEVLLATIRKKAEQPLDAKGFSALGTDVENVKKLMATLGGSFDNLFKKTKEEKLQLLPDSELKKIKDVTNALSVFEAEIKKAERAGKVLREAQQALESKKVETTAKRTVAEEKKGAVEATQKDLIAIERIEANLQARVAEAEAATRALEEAEKALAEAASGDKRKKPYKDAVKAVEIAKANKSNKAVTEAETAAIAENAQKREELSRVLEQQTAEYEKAGKAAERAAEAEALAQTRVDTAEEADKARKIAEQKTAYETLYKTLSKIIPDFKDLGITADYTEDNLNKLKKAAEDLGDNAIAKLDGNFKDASEAMDEATVSADKLKTSINDAGDSTREFDDAAAKVGALKDRIKQFLGVAGAVEVFRRAARDAISTITELDATMTEMAVVTDLTVGDYWDQLPEYSKQASALGVSINSAYKAATLYYQQGLKGNEVTKISAETLKMAKIAGLDTADATDKMTAALRGFNMELNETSAQRIADVYSELAAITAADTKEIANAMTKTASIASSAGMEFETTAAFLSQIIETTRESAETAGTAMKTVIARFQELKKSPDEIGEIDGEIVDANAIETALRSVGVSLRDTGGQFRELDDVFLELSSKWDGLDKNTQRYIATIAAGSRQQSRFIAMMQNYGRTQELVSAANNSAGASQRQFEKTTESLESKVERLKNSWHEFTMGILNSDFVKFGVDVLNTFMEIINKATNSLNGLGNSLTKITSVLAIFQMGKKIFQKLMPTIDGFMLKMVKKFYGYGEEAGKQFGKGLSGNGSNGDAKAGEKKKKREEMTTEERAEYDKQKRVEITRESFLARASGDKKRTIKDDLSAMGGVATSLVKRPVENRERIQLHDERAHLVGEQSTLSLDKTRISAQIAALQGERRKALEKSRGSSRVKEIDQQLTKKQAQLKQVETRLGEIGARLPEIDARTTELGPQKTFKGAMSEASAAVKGAVGNATKKLFTTEKFKTASESRKAAEEAATIYQEQQLSFGAQYQDYSKLRESHEQYQQLRGEKGETLTKRHEEIKKLEGKKGRSQDEVKRLEQLKKEEATYQELIKEEKKYQETREKYGEQIEQFETAETNFNETTKKYKKDQEAAWQTLGDNITKAGGAVIGVGTAVSAVGGIFSQLGLEEVGEGFAKVGNVITILGGALMALGPIISLIGKIGVTEAGKLTIAGYTTQLAWWWILAIVVAVVALAVGVALLFNAIKNNSPEAKLQKAQEAADEAAEAADRAKEAYEGLATALDDLASKQEALDNMTRGTDEWNKALQESNSAVLDLIEKYPELAGLVENVDGQLKLDTASDEVRDVMKKYEERSVVVRGESISAQQNVNEKKLDLARSKLDENATIEHNNRAEEGWGLFGKSVGYGAAGTAGAGALTGAAIGAILGPAGAAIGAGLGAVIGGIAGAAGGAAVGAVAGSISASMLESNAALGVNSEEEAQEKTDEIAAAMASGEAGTTRDELRDYLVETQKMEAQAAESVADRLWENADALKEYGNTVIESNAAQEAYYQAMVTNAQQLIDIGKYDKDEIAQMNNAIDSDRMKAIEDAQKAKYAEEAKGSESEEYEKEKEAYAKQKYGENAQVKGNKIIYYDENGEKQTKKLKDEEWTNALAAAKATEEAAEAMELVPEAIRKAAQELGKTKENANIIEKALTDSNKLTKEEFNTFKTAVGVDENGNVNKENQALKDLYNSNSDFEKIYGSYDAFIEEYQDIVDEQNKAWGKIEKNAKNLNLVGEDGKVAGAMANMSAEAATTWTNLLKDVMPGGGDASAVDDALSSFLTGKSQEEVNSIMSQIGAIDATDSLAWDNLAYTLKQMGIVTNSTDSALQAFIEEAKVATNAIAKIDFSNFNNQTNETIKLLNKAKEGARNYSEDEYKSFVAANKGLENDFIQIGDEFIYLGTSMKDLTDAVQENTISQLQEANRLIEAQKNMAGILEDEKKVGAISTNADVDEQRSWLMEVVSAFAKEGEDVADLGIAGLTLDTNFATLDAATIKKMVEGVLEYKGDYGELSKLQEKNMRDANVAAYTTNNAAFNALRGVEGGKWADEHQDALQVQATQAGVGEVMIQSYRNAADQFNKRMEEIAKGENLNGMSQADAEEEAKETFKMASQNLLDMMETVEENKEAQEQIDALSPLADRVAAAIEKQRQDTIDKLSDVNDSINTANDRMISKIQEQIDDARQERENQKAKDNLTDMYSQQAYLAMDTSGANALQMVDNEQAIKDAEQEYEDMMIDHAIQQLQDANEKAAEQRERQINLLQQQLDYELESGLIAEEAAQIVRESLDRIAAGDNVTNTRLGEFMNNELNTLGGMDKESAKTEWNEIIMQAIGNYDPDTGNKNSGDGSENNTKFTGNVIAEDGEKGKKPLEATGVEAAKQAEKALKDAKTALFTNDAGGIANINNNAAFQEALASYNEATGSNLTSEDFGNKVVEDISAKEVSGTFPSGVSVSGLNPDGWTEWDNDIKVSIGGVTVGSGGDNGKLSVNRIRGKAADQGEITELSGGSPSTGWLAMYQGEPYIYYDGEWKNFDNNANNGRQKGRNLLRDKMREYLTGRTAFKTGGLADFTGPAWLDGTKSRPEYVLNSAQTEKFFSLIDVLERYDTEKQSTAKTGDSYFDIDINVEKLDNDYDLEQIANKIRGMIYEDATYRNVNAIDRR